MNGKIQRTLCSLVILSLLITLFSTSNATAFSLAEGNVFDCIEGEGDCDEDNFGAKSESDAEENKEKTTEIANEKSGLTWVDGLRTILAFIFVIVLLFWLLKFVNRKNRAYNKNQLMRNMGGISLGQHKSIQLVLIGDAYYLIGVGDDIRLLKEVTDPAEIENLKAHYDDENTVESSNLIERISTSWKKMGQGSKDDTTKSNTDSPEAFKSMLNTRLDELKKERKKQIRRATEKEQNRDE